MDGQAYEYLKCRGCGKKFIGIFADDELCEECLDKVWDF